MDLVSVTLQLFHFEAFKAKIGCGKAYKISLLFFQNCTFEIGPRNKIINKYFYL